MPFPPAANRSAGILPAIFTNAGRPPAILFPVSRMGGGR